MTGSSTPNRGEEPRPAELRVGVVGLGVAFNFVAARVSGWSHVRFTAACDLRPAALKTFHDEFGGEVYEDLAAMCAGDQVDVVYVATPNKFHREQVLTAIAHGKHVIVDKPMALTAEDCAVMNDAAEAAGVVLLCGHTHSYGPAVRAMRRIISSGELGRVRMINTWHFNEWMYRPRASWELDPLGGGNLVYNQGAHQIDIVRVLGGGRVRSVRATTGVWDQARPAAGAYSAYLDFEDGTVATLVYNSYAHFDTAELTGWRGEGPRGPETNLKARERLAQLTGPDSESGAKEGWRYGSDTRPPIGEPALANFGLTIVSCERGDIRQSPDGLVVYGDNEIRTVLVEPDLDASSGAFQNMYDVLYAGAPVLRSGRWGEATVEVLEAIMTSSRERREVTLSRQVAGVE
ncbi:Gfo/Idh/MocA family protein [Nocardia sienata]|uniref:Gfo/Idh/MocA family protein n=1 Tax=Nocardia sienata TaxID=248552 RepID=UPI0007A4579C|nr:Gfo/Idh/MocA family oxidoreductase [Nocardia sienata]